MTKKSSFNDTELEDAGEGDFSEQQSCCEGCALYETCYSDGGEVPNYVKCFLVEDDDAFFESEDGKKEYHWKEMSYNKYTER